MQLTLFSPEVDQSIKYKVFKQTQLGQFHSSLPLQELAALLPSPKTKVGAPAWFSNEGKVALQFLKCYEGCSDAKLLERINTSWTLQFFCGIQLPASKMIGDKDLIWKTRAWVAKHLDWDVAQSTLIDAWKPQMELTHIGLSDATCYESYIKYPTDVKLLWDCCKWLEKELQRMRKALGAARQRNKYTEQKAKQLNYARRRRKTHKQTRGRQRQLLHLCQRQIGQLAHLIVLWNSDPLKDPYLFTPQELQRFDVIGQIYAQQQRHYDDPSEKIDNRIVSLYKPYLRPIVRGKENKRVEFGAKVNTWQVGGLNFIEYLSFNAFHEGIRLKQGIAFHKKHFGKLSQLGADRIYATNENRRYCTKLGIQTNFAPKGSPPNDKDLVKQQKQIRSAIATLRATQLEGSYGNDKNHYGLRKVKARNQLTEQAWIFFGMMSANAMKIARKKTHVKTEEQKARAA